MGSEAYVFLIPVGLIVVLLLVILSFVPLGLWISALAAGVRVSIFTLVGMRLRRVPPGKIIMPLVKAVKAGLPVTIDKLEAHYLAGGNVDQVIDALIAAHRADIPLTFERAAAIDLAGRQVLEAVKMSVNPKVIETPVISAVAKDGIELKCKARVTVRANIDRLVGGAGEPTIIARVGEGIVTTVGSSADHKAVLENPDLISKTVLEKGLDAGTAFEILSIDIADVDVGRNIGAQLQIDQAEADKNIAQAKAAERRFAAQALEQEMLARVQEMRARVVEAEAQVPLAISEALKSGNLGVLDYYAMRNIVADTQMRESLARSEEPEFGDEPKQQKKTPPKEQK
ncbi:MAG TPA: flotillin-like protein FloA [Firmicutes bacterium]|nr:flotillin-like protein FloA [Bacillota bacterium]